MSPGWTTVAVPQALYSRGGCSRSLSFSSIGGERLADARTFSVSAARRRACGISATRPDGRLSFTRTVVGFFRCRVWRLFRFRGVRGRARDGFAALGVPVESVLVRESRRRVAVAGGNVFGHPFDLLRRVARDHLRELRLRRAEGLAETVRTRGVPGRRIATGLELHHLLPVRGATSSACSRSAPLRFVHAPWKPEPIDDVPDEPSRRFAAPATFFSAAFAIRDRTPELPTCGRFHARRRSH